MKLNENTLELAVMDWFGEIGYETRHATEIEKERENFSQVTLNGRLRDALRRINPQMADDILDDAFRKLTAPNSPSLIVNNHTLHRHFTEGVPVEYQRTDGTIGGDYLRVFDFENPENNEFLAVNQFTVTDNKYVRRADVVVFVNGLPLAVLELKNPISDTATIKTAYNQFQTYKTEIPALFHYNAALVLSDGLITRIGTLTANFERFMPWRDTSRSYETGLNELICGVFAKQRLLDLLRYFIVFEDDGSGNLVKKMAGYHQYHAEVPQT